MIYRPAEDSYLLEKEVKLLAKNKSVLDIGSGSGIQALAALSSGASSVTASDINPEVVKHLNKLKKDNKNIKVIQSDLFSKIEGKFDLIVFNPPYLPEDEREDEESALTTTGGKNGDEIILEFLNQSVNHLNKNGMILLLVSSLTPKLRINNLLINLGLDHEVLSSEVIFFESLDVWLIKDKV